ncbi:hypothetical protein Tco_0649536, partial [Tanacetum coccineum]
QEGYGGRGRGRGGDRGGRDGGAYRQNVDRDNYGSSGDHRDLRNGSGVVGSGQLPAQTSSLTSSLAAIVVWISSIPSVICRATALLNRVPQDKDLGDFSGEESHVGINSNESTDFNTNMEKNFGYHFSALHAEVQIEEKSTTVDVHGVNDIKTNTSTADQRFL